MRTRPGWTEPEVWFRIIHLAQNGHNGTPVATYRDQTVEIALGPRGRSKTATWAPWNGGHRQTAGEIVRVKELLFDAAALRGIEEKLVGFLKERGEVTVPEFKEMTGLSRKYIIPLLEHFDAQKITLRVGDKRVLRKGK